MNQRASELMSELAGPCGVTGPAQGDEPTQGIDRVWQTLLTHFQEHDQQLETYLAAAVASN